MKSLILFLCLTLVGCAHAKNKGYPDLFFEHSYLFDDVCAQGKNIKPEWIKETQEKIPAYQIQWSKDSGPLFETLFTRFPGKFFIRKELTATISACPYFISFSAPLTIKLVDHLESYCNEMGRKQRPDYAFTWVVCHELLHTRLKDNFPPNTPLLKKYENESYGVKVHLHLLALEQWPYPKANRMDLLKWAEEFYPSATKGPYPRAWEIVNKEGHEVFIKELESLKH